MLLLLFLCFEQGQILVVNMDDDKCAGISTYRDSQTENLTIKSCRSASELWSVLIRGVRSKEWMANE